jgi:hypothetical protein
MGVSGLLRENFFLSKNTPQRFKTIKLLAKPSYFYKLVRLFSKKGKALNMSKLFLGVMLRVYHHLEKPSSSFKSLQEGYLNTSEFVFVLNNSRQMYNVSTILD